MQAKQGRQKALDERNQILGIGDDGTDHTPPRVRGDVDRAVRMRLTARDRPSKASSDNGSKDNKKSRPLEGA